VLAALGGVSGVTVVADAAVAGLYGATVMDSICAAGLPANLIEIPSGESSKNLATYGQVMDRLFSLKPAFDRKAAVVALGGGVTGDLAGFVAATALRGVRWVQCPTTLLADVDASVGGKTAVDHPAGKNLIGAFHQPSAVLIDVDTLATLPERELRSGLAECIKHGFIRDASLLDTIEAHADALLAREPDLMAEFIARNVAIKAAVVVEDEKESGRRADLNYGHTIGHGIEAFAGYTQMTHGEAVSLGMVAAARVAAGRGLVGEAFVTRTERICRRMGLPVRRAGLNFDAIWQIIQHDKKNIGGKVRMVLPVAPGEVDIYDDITEGQVRAAVEFIGKK